MRHSGNMGKEGKMNKAEAREPKAGDHTRPAHAAGVGNEKKADVRGAQEGGDKAEGAGMGHLRGAVKELHSQHPHAHHDHGPHHGGSEHIRHEPMHGMKPSKR